MQSCSLLGMTFFNDDDDDQQFFLHRKWIRCPIIIGKPSTIGAVYPIAIIFRPWYHCKHGMQAAALLTSQRSFCMHSVNCSYAIIGVIWPTVGNQPLAMQRSRMRPTAMSNNSWWLLVLLTQTMQTVNNDGKSARSVPCNYSELHLTLEILALTLQSVFALL